MTGGAYDDFEDEDGLSGPAPLSAQQQAWVDAKPKDYERPTVSAEDTASMEAIVASHRAQVEPEPSLLNQPPDEVRAPVGVKSPARRMQAGGADASSPSGKVYGRTAPDAGERQGGFTNDAGGAAGPSGATQTEKNAYNPGDMAKFGAKGERERHFAEQQMSISAPTVSGESLVKPPKGADSTLADSLAPQLGFGFEVDVVQVTPPGLADKFIVPPFSILDTRQAYWQDRRRSWMSLGIRGETSAEHSYVPRSGNSAGQSPEGVYGGAGGAPGPLKQALGTTADEQKRDGTAEAKNHQGRKQGLIYDHGAPASDPSFYSKKTAVEKALGRTISIEEFRRDHYDRDESLAGQSDSVKTGTSVFDPVLCEIAYRWFSGVGATVLDPFAGGAVRGVVAGALGRRYFGNELRPEQIADNRRQASALFAEDGGFDFGREGIMPEWIEGDATDLDAGPLSAKPFADLVFTCPPYADLEVYSDDPRDLSTMPYPKFREMYVGAMAQAAARLKPNRFVVWVIGEARGKDGRAYGLVSDTVQAARECGLALYNEAILVNSVGSAALRAQRIVRTRKLTRVHQHVFVFVKGDPKKAAAACGNAEVEA